MSRAEAHMRDAIDHAVRAVQSGSALRRGAILQFFIVASAFSLFGQVELFSSVQGFITSSTSVLVATAAACLELLLVRSIWRWSTTEYPMHAMFAVFMAIGALRLVLLDWFNVLFGVTTLFSSLLEILAGALQGAAWLTAASLYHANRVRFLRARDEVLDEQARLEYTATQQAALADVLAKGLADTVAKRVSLSVSHTRALISDALPLDVSRATLRDVAKSLRRAIDEDIRPMSHELWDVSPAEQMRLTLPMVMRMGCYTRPYPLLSAFVAVVLIVAPMALAMRLPEQALLLLLGQTALVGLMLWLYDRTIRDHGSDEAFDFWVGILAALYVVSLPPGSMPSFGWTESEARYWAVYCSFGMILLLVFLSMVQGLAGTWASLGMRARSSLSEGEVARKVQAQEMLETSRKLARHLHTSLQGRLMAISLELEQAADDGHSEYVRTALQRLDELLQAPLVGAFEPGVADLDAALRKLADEWSAIADVTLRLELGGAVSSSSSALILGIAEEAIANAVRHAGAQQVEIDVTSDGADVVVRAVNDGESRVSGSAGMGSSWLDSISPDSWSLTALPDNAGAVLEVRLRKVLEVQETS